MASKKAQQTGATQKIAADEPFDFTRSSQKLSPDRFFRFISEYPNRDAISVYVYRLVPVINRKLAGIENSYIEVAQPPLDEEYMLRAHGSGKYHLMFSDGNRPRGLTEIAKCTLEVYDPRVDPVVNPLELVVGLPANDRWIQKYLSAGWLVEGGKMKAPVAGGSGGSDVLAKTVSDLAGQVAAGKVPAREAGDDVIRRALDVLTEQHGRGDELNTAFAIADRLQPRPDPLQAQMFGTLTKLMLERGAPAAPAAAGPDPIVQLKATAELLKEFGWGARDAPAEGSMWGPLFAALPGIFQYGAQMLQGVVALRMGPQLVPTVPAAAGPVFAPAVENASLLPGANDMLNPLDINALMQVGRDAIHAFEEGFEGDAFAQALVARNRAGQQLYIKLLGMGRAGILSAVSMVPGLAEEIGTRRAELETWLDAFIAYGHEPETGQEPTSGGKAA